MKLMLGTVQFGLDYGVTNSEGQTPKEEISKILDFCKSVGISYLDTAYSYGNAEKMLGEFDDKLHDFNIVTKLAYLQKSRLSMRDSILKSFENLGLQSVYGVLFHNPDDLVGENGKDYFKQLQSLKNEKKMQKIGVSVYNPDQLTFLMGQYPLDIVQIPLNIFDQRFLENDLLKIVKKKGIEIHVRSVFLQGLLLERPDRLNPFFEDIRKNLEHFNRVINEMKVSPIEFLLAFVNSITEIDKIVVGVNTERHLIEIVHSYGKEINYNFSELKIKDEKYLLPINWKLS